MSGELVKVNFHGDELVAVRDGERVQVSLRRCCENLGLAHQVQMRKLKAKAWAVVTEMVTTGADGKSYSMSMLDLDSLPMWLATIDPRKVKEHVREKLARYQREAARVLADHFFGRRGDVAAILTQLLRRVEELEARAAAPALPAVHIPTHATPRATIQDRLRFKNWSNTSKRQRAQIRRLANLWLDLRHNETPDVAGGPGGPLLYYGHQIVILDEAIDEVREEYIKRDRENGPGLFDGKKAA